MRTIKIHLLELQRFNHAVPDVKNYTYDRKSQNEYSEFMRYLPKIEHAIHLRPILSDQIYRVKRNHYDPHKCYN